MATSLRMQSIIEVCTSKTAGRQPLTLQPGALRTMTRSPLQPRRCADPKCCEDHKTRKQAECKRQALDSAHSTSWAPGHACLGWAFLSSAKACCPVHSSGSALRWHSSCRSTYITSTDASGQLSGQNTHCMQQTSGWLCRWL